MARYLLVANPTARSGKAQDLISHAEGLVRGRGHEVRFLPTAPHGGTVPAVSAALLQGGWDAVLALGGDGTFAEVARGILGAGAQVPLGMLPAGTANDQARSFGLEGGAAWLPRNLEVVEAGHVTRLDVGRLTRLSHDGVPGDELLFFDSVGFGLQAEVLAVRNRDRKLVDQIPLVREVYRDEAVYAGAVLNRYLASWVEPTKFVAEVELDGRTLVYPDLTDLIVNATPIYAGSWVFDRACEPDDGLFELVPIQGRRDWFLKAVRDLAHVSLVRDNLDALGITSSACLPGARFELRLTRPARQQVASQADGEEWLAGERFRVEVLPGALPLLTPAGWRAPWKD